jgi:hypothetical protein
MKRFDTSVENMLIGKYGIKWNYLWQQYSGYYRTYKNGTVTQEEFWPDYVQPLTLLGILEYERSHQYDIYCRGKGLLVHILNDRAYRDANKIVRAEINKQQGGQG